MADPVRCAVYTRKSSEEGLEQSFNSLHAQREACEAYVTSQKHEGWRLIPDAYDDGGFSGGSMERPGLKLLMADVAAGLIDTVVVYKVDRLTRSLADFAKMVELFDAHKVSFVSVTQAFNTTTSMGRLTLNVLLSFAQFEREVTGERIRDKIAASKAKGMWMGGLVPLGYDVVDRSLVVNDKEADEVRFLFERYAKLRAVDAVVAEANAHGIRSKVRTTAGGRTSGGMRLSRGSLYAIIANPVYAGEIGHKGQRFEGKHEGIVPPALFDTVQNILAANRRKQRGRRGTAATPMLSGLVRTSEGERLIATHTQKGNRRYRYYAGADLRIPADELETLIAQALGERLTDSKQLAALLPDISQLGPGLIARAAELGSAILHVPKRRREIATALIGEVAIGDSAVAVDLTLAGLGLTGTASVMIPATIGKAKSRLALVVPGSTQPAPDTALVAIIAQARDWFERLTSGTAASLRSLARDEGVTPAYIRQLIGAAFLAPDLVAMVVEGRQPAALTAHRMRELLPLPDDWAAQRVLIAGL